jgi:hypothetical protein
VKPPCIFCDRASGSVEHIWPDWLCREWVDDMDDWLFLRQQGDSPLQWVEEAGRQVDVTTDCVCDTCNRGWMHRLEDKVSSFLKPMFVGTPTTITAKQRNFLARWAVKTAVVFECDYPTSPRTPRSVCKRIRQGPDVPLGYEVFLADYSGPRILDQRRQTMNHSKGIPPDLEHVSLTHLLIGRVLIYVFADPWVRHERAVAGIAANGLIPMVGGDPGEIKWPAAPSVDELRFSRLRDPTTWIQLPPLEQ